MKVIIGGSKTNIPVESTEMDYNYK